MALTEQAGKDSPHLDQDEKVQAEQHSAPAALVIHEVLRAEGEEELQRRTSAVLWSGLAAGLSMGFSFLCLALIRAGLPDAPWARLVYGAGYTTGFLVVILGRQALFTESTLTAMLPFLVRRDLATLFLTLRFWAIVLSANLAGTLIFACLLAFGHLFDDNAFHTLRLAAHEVVDGAFVPKLLRGILAGWLIALMAWLLPSARSARVLVIVLLTYVVGMAGLSHIVAGSVEASFSVLVGDSSVRDYFLGFFFPTLIGNVIGGVALVALLNHAPLAGDLQADVPEPATTRSGPPQRP